MGSIGAGELLVILFVALLLFGAGRIADIGKGLGQGIRNFKKGLKEGEEDDRRLLAEEPKSSASPSPKEKSSSS